MGFVLVHTSPEGYVPQDLAVHKAVLCPTFPKHSLCPRGHVNLSMSPDNQEASVLPPLRGSLLLLSPCSGRSPFSSLQVQPFISKDALNILGSIRSQEALYSATLPSLCLTFSLFFTPTPASDQTNIIIAPC